MPLFGVHYTLFLGMSYSIGVNETVELIWLFCDQLFASFQVIELAYAKLNKNVVSTTYFFFFFCEIQGLLRGYPVLLPQWGGEDRGDTRPARVFEILSQAKALDAHQQHMQLQARKSQDKAGQVVAGGL